MNLFQKKTIIHVLTVHTIFFFLQIGIQSRYFLRKNDIDGKPCIIQNPDTVQQIYLNT